MKKMISFMTVLFCVACAPTTTNTCCDRRYFKTDMEGVKVNYDKGVVYKELPTDHLMDEKIIKRTLPVKEEDVKRDVHYILQTFLYENGRKNRNEVLSMGEDTMIEWILPDMVKLLGIEFEKLPKTFKIPVFDEVISPTEIFALNIKSIVDAKQTSNVYKLLGIEAKEDGKYVATVEKRYLDNHQYAVRMTQHKDYDKFQKLVSMGTAMTDNVEKAIISSYIRNLITYNDKYDTLTVIPLEHHTRTRQVQIEFKYDKDGYLRLTEKGLVELIS